MNMIQCAYNCYCYTNLVGQCISPVFAYICEKVLTDKTHSDQYKGIYGYPCKCEAKIHMVENGDMPLGGMLHVLVC